MSLVRFVARRSGEIVITMFIIATLTFVMFRLMPSDPAGMMLNPYRTPEMVEWHKRLWGLDKSYAEQYLLFLRNMLRGEFGKSFFSDQNVYDILTDRLPATLLLFTTMTVVSFSLGMHLGRFIAWRRGSRLEYGSTVFSVFMFSMPFFWIALLSMWIFSFKLGLFPLGGMKTPELWDAAANTNLLVKVMDIGHHLFLPLTVGVFAFAPGIMLMMRNVMVETFGEEYITTARAKGLSEGDVRDHHASRNVMLPMVTALTLSVAGSFTGSVVMEVIFSWPGVGAKFLDAAVNYDYPVVQGAFIIMGAVLLISILVADILCAYLDPRVRLR
jgi:peptide/nickel transport system permease protein